MSPVANDVYLSMRDLALKGHPPKNYVDDGSPNPWAVLMDIHYPKAYATVAAYHDGTGSVYLGNGGGFLGGGASHESIRSLSKAALKIAGEALPLTTASEYPLPSMGSVAFYLVMTNGVQTATATEESLGSGKDRLSKLYNVMHAIISEYRHIDESGKWRERLVPPKM